SQDYPFGPRLGGIGRDRGVPPMPSDGTPAADGSGRRDLPVHTPSKFGTPGTPRCVSGVEAVFHGRWYLPVSRPSASTCPFNASSNVPRLAPAFGSSVVSRA